MIRSLLVVISIFSIATLLSEGSAIGLLWYRGQLNADVLNEVRYALTGQNRAAIEDTEEPETAKPSSDDVIKNRSMRILDLNTREKELAVLKAMIASKTSELLARQQVFEKKQQDFEKQLKDMTGQMNSAAIEQTRGILQAMPTTDAVSSLMQLPVETAVTLLKGMPEKTIAKILQEFVSNPEVTENAPRIERGQEIFEAISRGEPNSSLLKAAAQQISPPPAAAPNAK